MNAERLHAIIKVLKGEMDGKNLVGVIGNLVSSLRAMVQQASAQNQQTLAAHRNSVYEALSNAKSDTFSPAWRQILTEIGGEEYFGSTLRQTIETTLERNQMTPTVAADELDELRKRMEIFHTALTQTSSAFATFKIGDETLTPGECEVGILIPRLAVDDRLVNFADELKEFNFILNTFSLVATDEPEAFTINTISSSDFLVYLAAHPTSAACVAVAIERVVALYKTLLEIRKLQVDLRTQGVPDKLTEGIADHANNLMDHGIEKLSVEIVQQFHKGNDAGRRNELTNSVRISLNKIANRIDSGYNVEVRCEPLTPGESAQATEELKTSIATIQSASANMQFLKLEGKPLLRLSEKATTKGTEKPTTSRKKGRSVKKEPAHETGESE